MKIKTKQKLNLPELIQHVWENDIEITNFLSNEELPSGKNVRVHVNPRDVAGGRCAGVSVDSGEFVVDDSYTFTVEVEEELTEDTAIPHIVHIYKDTGGRRRAENLYKESVSSGRFPTKDEPISMAMYSSKDDGALTLIWSRESGIPESGVLEVDDE